MFLVHYGEIGLKGKNRPFFEKKLVKNIRKQTGMRVKRIPGRLLAWGKDGLDKVFGIAYYAEAMEFKYEELKKELPKLIKGKSMKVITTRADKSFPLTSMEVNREIGEILVRKGWKADMVNPDVRIYLEIVQGKVYVYFEKIKGLGGLPVGVSGKVISLLSGGIDSPVATWYAMKRGCEVICLHVHPYPTNEKALKLKMKELLEKLGEYTPTLKCYFIPYFHFQAIEIEPKYELIVFRRFLMKLAEEVAKKEGAKAIVTGESLGQVASQTLESIYVTEQATSLPVLRPLIGMDKEEIVRKAKEIGTYEISIKKYKDCCSIVARHPATKPRLEDVIRVEPNMEEIIGKSLEEAEVIEIP